MSGGVLNRVSRTRRARQVENVLVYENVGVPASATKMVTGRDKWWSSEMELQPTACPVEWVDAEHPLFLLYTSGSTGGRRGGVTGRRSRQQGHTHTADGAAREGKPVMCPTRRQWIGVG